MRRNRWLSAMLPPLLLACGGAPGGTTPAASQYSQLPEPVIVGVGVDASYSCFFVGDQAGIFKKYGLNVQLKQFEQGGLGVDAVVANQIQLSGTSDANALTKAGKTDTLRIIAVYESSGKYVKVVARKGVSTVREMKRIGVVKSSLSEYAASKLLAANGIRESDVKFIAAGPAEMPALLSKGDIDGTVIWEPWPTQAVKLGASVIGSTGDFGYSYEQVLLAKQDWLSSHRDYAVRFNQALAEACRKVSTDVPGTVKADSAASNGNIDEAATRMATDNIKFENRPPNDQDRQSYLSIIEWQKGRGLITGSLDLNTIVTSAYWPK